MLSALEKSAGFDSLVNRLRDPDKYDEAASVLECGARLHAARFEVAFDQVSSDKKVPDIAAKYAPTQDILWVEVSRLGESEGEKEESRKFMAIGNAFLASLGRLEHAAKLYKSLAWPRISELVTDIGTAIEQCLRDGRMREVRRAGVAAFAVASVGDAALRDWCRSEDIELNQIIGPQRERDTSRRLRRKIGDELRQLAGTDTGVVVVDLDLSTVMGDKPALVSEVEEFVYERPDLLALVLRTRYLASWSADEERAFGPHRWSRSCHSGVLTDEHFVFLNAYCRGRVAPAVLPRIITAFGR